MAQVLKTADIPVGNSKEIHPATRIQDLIKQAYLHGPIFQLPTPHGGRQLVISGYSLVDEVCNDTYYDKKLSSSLQLLQGLAGDGLFTAETDNPNWRKAHAILLPNFSLEAMRSYLPMMIEIAEQMLDKWMRLGPDEVIDVGDHMSRLTLDTVGLCAFGHQFDSFGRKDLHPFIKSMLNVLKIAQKLAGMPPNEQIHMDERRQMNEDCNLVLSTADQLIQERKAEGEAGLKKHDLLSAMLTGVDKKTGEKLDDLNIRSQAVTFLIAGHETTSNLLAFAFYFLLNHPEVVAKAVAEVDHVLGTDISKPPTYEQVHKLRYITQVLNETLRLVPPAPIFSRSPYETRLLGGKYEVTPDDQILVLIPMLHRDRSVWGDYAESFRPDLHFSPEAERKRPVNAFKPFGTGQRACIGRQFAMQEAALALGMVLQRFVLYTPRIYQLRIDEALTIKPANLLLQVKPRDRVDQMLLPLGSETRPVEAQPAAEKQPENVPAAGITTGTALLALYGSNAGTSEELANQIANDGSARGWQASVGSLDDYYDKLPRDGAVVIVSSSYNGGPPDNATNFAQWLQSGLAKDALKGVHYTVFGCGSRYWSDTYQAIPQRFDSQLEQAGAKRIYQLGEGNVAGDFDEEFSAWYRGLWPGLARALSLPIVMQQATTAQKQKPLYEVEIVRRPHPFPFVNSFGALPMTVLENRDLVTQNSALGLEQSTRHLQIALPAGLAYRAGDHLGVIASNDPDQVKRVADHFRFDQQTIIQLHSTNGRKPFAPIDEPISVYDLLANYVELQDVAKREHIKRMAEYTSSEMERQHLLHLVGEKKQQVASYKAEILDKHLSVIDILEEHPLCALPFSLYLECLSPLRPRYYSISSSPLVKPDECSITVSIVRTSALSGQGMFEGVCSTYLDSRQAGDIIYAFIQNTSGPFHLPQDAQVPLIMVAAGTGFAPFRGFLQSRAILQRQGTKLGPALLFFGNRHPEVDFLYKDELEHFDKIGVAKLSTAFSRLDPQKKVFVQDKLLEQKDEVWQLLQKGAIVYICGDADTMVPDVRKSFITLAQEKMRKSESEARAWLDDLVQKKRYLVDIWGGRAI